MGMGIRETVYQIAVRILQQHPEGLFRSDLRNKILQEDSLPQHCRNLNTMGSVIDEVVKDGLAEKTYMGNHGRPLLVWVGNPNSSVPVRRDSTPSEQLMKAGKDFQSHLGHELLERVKRISPAAFEKLVVELLRKMGFGDDVKVTGKSGDQGIDGYIYGDKLGLDIVCVQAKQYSETTVPSKDIQAFLGALHGKAKKGVFITTSTFSTQARKWVVDKIDPKVVLIDGERLVELMYKHDFGLTIIETFHLKKIDEDFFGDYE